MTESYKIFEDQLHTVIKYYPNLRIKENEQGLKYLRGTIDVYASDSTHAGTFLIEIHHKEGFPYCFPKLYEVGGDIPQEADYHKNPDETCCLTVYPLEILECKNGISLTLYIERHVVPYLANQCHKKIFGSFADEYSHGIDGLVEAYEDIMKTKDKVAWLRYIEFAFGIKTLEIRRNDLCLCGSGVKFKNCHDKVFDSLRRIGKINVMIQMKMISDSMKEQREAAEQ